jgi:hypothetical protein
LLPASCWFLACLILRPWRLRQYVPPKLRLADLHRTTRRFIPEDISLPDNKSLLPTYFMILSCLAYFRPLRWRRHAPPKRRMIFNGLHAL